MSSVLAALPAPRRKAQTVRRWKSFGFALLIELVVLLCALLWMTTAAPPAVQAVVPLSIDFLQPAAPPEPEKLTQAAAQKPAPVLPHLQAVLPVARATLLATASAQAPVAVTPPEIVPVATTAGQPSSSSLAASPVLANQPVSAAAAPLPTVDLAPAYNAKLAAAVQAAFELPAAASALNFKGRARIEFALHDGLASAIRVIVSSGLGAVDRAAVKAVQAGVFPSPPAALQAKEGGYQIWVACF